jgi:hypothetical protein
VAEEKLGMPQDAGAVIRNAVKKKHPIAVWRGRPDFPAAEFDSVGRANGKVLLCGVRSLQHGIGLGDATGIKVGRMNETRANKPTSDARTEK